MSSLAPPQGVWWKPINKQERLWVTVSFVWCIFMFVAMVGWYFVGETNIPTATRRITAEQFAIETQAFVEQYQTGEENGLPVVSPPPGDIYMLGRQWQWYPILELQKDEVYKLHLSSTDIQHGFSLQPLNLNFQVLPGQDYILTFTPTTAGEYRILCNEFCGGVEVLGHHTMTGKLTVKE